MDEHLDFYLKTESSVKYHIVSCEMCANTKYNVNSSKIIKNVILILKLKFTKLYQSKNISLDLIENYSCE